jgi:hypothetical protein
LLGDADEDWDIDNADVTVMTGMIGDAWGDAYFVPQADVDLDGVVTQDDVDALNDYLGN